MNQQMATIIAGALIAAAIALTNHWEPVQNGALLNRWTGAVYMCAPILIPAAAATELSCPPPPH